MNTAVRYDFRSDTVTRPSPAMRAAMATAEVGDDVFGDDPTVHAARSRMAAAMLGKEAALYLPSGTQSNLVALMAHCERGDEYIVGQMAHCYRWEAGGAAVLGSIQPQPLANQPDGTLLPRRYRGGDQAGRFALSPARGCSRWRTRSAAGRCRSPYIDAEATALARRRGLACHLDGARAFNAGVALGRVRRRGPGAAVRHRLRLPLRRARGRRWDRRRSVSAALIAKGAAHRARWSAAACGRSGMLAAAGLYALEHNVAAARRRPR